MKNKGSPHIPPNEDLQNIKTFFVSIQQPEHRCFGRSLICGPFQTQQLWFCWTTLGGYTESSVLKPSLLALHTAANNSLLATATLVIHCCLLTEMISISPTWQLWTKPGALLPGYAFWWLVVWLLKVRSQVADLFCCRNAKRLQTWRLST